MSRSKRIAMALRTGSHAEVVKSLQPEKRIVNAFVIVEADGSFTTVAGDPTTATNLFKIHPVSPPPREPQETAR